MSFQITKAKLLEDVPVFLKSVISTLATQQQRNLTADAAETEPTATTPPPETTTQHQPDPLIPSVWKERVMSL